MITYQLLQPHKGYITLFCHVCSDSKLITDLLLPTIIEDDKEVGSIEIDDFKRNNI